jgi:hypothetical protein
VRLYSDIEKRFFYLVDRIGKKISEISTFSFAYERKENLVFFIPSVIFTINFLTCAKHNRNSTNTVKGVRFL